MVFRHFEKIGVDGTGRKCGGGWTRTTRSTQMGSLREPRPGRKPSMPPRGVRPGFKRGRHKLPYWIAKQVVRDPMGFPEPCIALPEHADDETIAELCRGHTARLQQWIIDAEARVEKDQL